MSDVLGRRLMPACPVDHDERQWIDWRMHWLMQEFGHDRLRRAEVVLPTPKFFPDAYDATLEDVRGILDRVCFYLGVDPTTVEVSIYQRANPVRDGEWQRGADGLYVEEDGVFRVAIEERNLNDPLALVATIAHELGHVLLLGHGRLPPDIEDHEPLTDLLTVFFGLGVITANAVIREKYWDAGHWAGWSMKRSGYLTMPQYGYALAWFARARGEQHPDWAGALRLDVRTAFAQASAFLGADPGAPSASLTALRPVPLPRAHALPQQNEEPEEQLDPEQQAPRCTYCGADIGQLEEPADGPMVCAECEDSIVENDKDLDEEREQVRVHNSRARTWCVCALAFATFVILLNWLLR